MDKPARYIPAIRFDWLKPVYDPLFRENALRLYLIAQGSIKPGMRLHNIGCGTATLTILVKQLHPTVDVIGIDVDTDVLAIARAKVQQSGDNITLDHGLASSRNSWNAWKKLPTISRERCPACCSWLSLVLSTKRGVGPWFLER